jgi:hypothetical protein
MRERPIVQIERLGDRRKHYIQLPEIKTLILCWQRRQRGCLQRCYHERRSSICYSSKEIKHVAFLRGQIFDGYGSECVYNS